jgi:hypothetical protein
MARFEPNAAMQPLHVRNLRTTRTLSLALLASLFGCGGEELTIEDHTAVGETAGAAQHSNAAQPSNPALSVNGLNANAPGTEQPHPLGVGHGKVIFSDGSAKDPTPEVIANAQAELARRLKGEATPDVVWVLENELTAAFASPALGTQVMPAQIDLGLLMQDSEVVDWLVASVEPHDAASLEQLSGFLKNQIYHQAGFTAPNASADADLSASGLGVSRSAIVVNQSGSRYASECTAAGVPNPPTWGSSQWVRKGELTPNFLGGYAEVYTYTSTSPAGVCIALPRRGSSSDSSYSVLGIICQGNDTSRSCFWDSNTNTTINVGERVSIPGTGANPKIIGGTALIANDQGECTDCHAGENAFVVHPGSFLDLGSSLIAKNWVRPLIDERWNQNVGPGSEMDAAGAACSGCHNKGEGRRFPRLEDLSMYCGSVAGRAIGNTMPDSPAHRTAIANGCSPRAAATNFGSKEKWHDWFSPRSELPLLGDFNADGRQDIITFTLGSAADAWVSLSNGTGFDRSSIWHDFFGLNGEQLGVGDFDGDGKDDIVVAAMNSAGTVYVARSTGVACLDGASPCGFSSSSVWRGHVLAGEVMRTGDFNGDRKDDLAVFTKGSTADVLVQTSTGSRFNSSSTWHTFFSPNAEVPFVGDFNADGFDDIVTFTLGSNADAWVALSNGRSFGASSVWHQFFGLTGEVLGVADMNGDGMDDIVTFVPGNGRVYVALSTGSSFGASRVWANSFASSGQVPFVGDVNADHRADAVLFTKGSAGDVFVSLARP